MIPPEYVGREQSWLKHRVLAEYLVPWAIKLGSVSRSRQRLKLWYVDCFSGPWKAQRDDLADTSIAIGLKALREAQATWREQGYRFEVGAIFVEKDRRAFDQMRAFVETFRPDIDVRPLHGEFGAHVDEIGGIIGADPAFVLIDPTGWKGVAMDFIAPLVSGRWRDVMVNVMFDHINRFKDDPRGFLREQMKAFFGLSESELPPGLAEAELLKLYRHQLRKVCGIPYAADLAIPHPTMERTHFRLVVGGSDREVLKLFRQVERKVIGGEAAVVRSAAKEREREARSAQLSLLAPTPPEESPLYSELRAEGIEKARRLVPALLARKGPMRFDALWPVILSDCHVTVVDLANVAVQLRRDGVIDVDGMMASERTIKDAHVLKLPVRA